MSLFKPIVFWADSNEVFMLGAVIIFLLVLWTLGVASGETFGGFIHLLLVCAFTVFAIRLLSGKKVIQ